MFYQTGKFKTVYHNSCFIASRVALCGGWYNALCHFFLRLQAVEVYELRLTTVEQLTAVVKIVSMS